MIKVEFIFSNSKITNSRHCIDSFFFEPREIKILTKLTLQRKKTKFLTCKYLIWHSLYSSLFLIRNRGFEILIAQKFMGFYLLNLQVRNNLVNKEIIISMKRKSHLILIAFIMSPYLCIWLFKFSNRNCKLKQILLLSLILWIPAHQNSGSPKIY